MDRRNFINDLTEKKWNTSKDRGDNEPPLGKLNPGDKNKNQSEAKRTIDEEGNDTRARKINHCEQIVSVIKKKISRD
jgi:hypothetical protein